MPAKRTTTDDQDIEILAKARPDSELSISFGLQISQIESRRYYLKHRLGKTRGRKKSKAANYHEKIIDSVVRGKSQGQIANQAKLTIGTVAGYIRRRRIRHIPNFNDPQQLYRGKG